MKQKNSKTAKNKYKHNLNRHTIITDLNSFEVKGVRYLLSGDNIINIESKEVYKANWDRIKDYF